MHSILKVIREIRLGPRRDRVSGLQTLKKMTAI